MVIDPLQRRPSRPTLLQATNSLHTPAQIGGHGSYLLTFYSYLKAPQAMVSFMGSVWCFPTVVAICPHCCKMFWGEFRRLNKEPSWDKALHANWCSSAGNWGHRSHQGAWLAFVRSFKCVILTKRRGWVGFGVIETYDLGEIGASKSTKPVGPFCHFSTLFWCNLVGCWKAPFAIFLFGENFWRYYGRKAVCRNHPHLKL